MRRLLLIAALAALSGCVEFIDQLAPNHGLDELGIEETGVVLEGGRAVAFGVGRGSADDQDEACRIATREANEAGQSAIAREGLRPAVKPYVKAKLVDPGGRCLVQLKWARLKRPSAERERPQVAQVLLLNPQALNTGAAAHPAPTDANGAALPPPPGATTPAPAAAPANAAGGQPVTLVLIDNSGRLRGVQQVQRAQTAQTAQTVSGAPQVLKLSGGTVNEIHAERETDFLRSAEKVSAFALGLGYSSIERGGPTLQLSFRPSDEREWTSFAVHAYGFFIPAGESFTPLDRTVEDPGGGGGAQAFFQLHPPVGLYPFEEYFRPVLQLGAGVRAYYLNVDVGDDFHLLIEPTFALAFRLPVSLETRLEVAIPFAPVGHTVEPVVTGSLLYRF